MLHVLQSNWVKLSCGFSGSIVSSIADMQEMRSTMKLELQRLQQPNLVPHLPVEIAEKISNFIPPIRVRKPDELQLLFDTYPFEYLAVEIRFADCDSDQGSKVLIQAPKKLREVVAKVWTYPLWKRAVESLLDRELKCLTLDTCLTFPSAETFVERCCKSRNEQHVLALKFMDNPRDQLLDKKVDELVDSTLSDLVHNDDALIWLDLYRATCGHNCTKLLKSLTDPFAYHLQHLNLSGSNFGFDEAICLGEALRANCNLLTVEIIAGNLSDDSMGRIGSGLEQNTVLKGFFGTFAGVSSQAATNFAMSVLKNTSLESLSFEGVELHLLGSVGFAQLLESSRTLRFLSLNQCMLASYGCKLVAIAVAKNPILEELQIFSCKFSKTERRRLYKLSRGIIVQVESRNQTNGPPKGRKVLWQSLGVNKLTFACRVHQWWMNSDAVGDSVYRRLQA